MAKRTVEIEDMLTEKESREIRGRLFAIQTELSRLKRRMEILHPGMGESIQAVDLAMLGVSEARYKVPKPNRVFTATVEIEFEERDG